MRTMFVNPSARRRKKTRKNPRAKRRHHAAPVRRRRRRNAGITPFVASSNPLMANPRRRRAGLARRSNPFTSPKRMLEDTLANLGGAGIGVAANYFAINRIENVWARNGARAAAAIGSAYFIPGKLGAAAAGAMMYPAILELVDHFAPKGWGEKEADLDMLSADLEALLNVA
jgi:hypothetical protein